MNELIKRMLAVGARLSPHNGSRGIVDGVSGPRHVFAVALHVALLEVSGETMQILIVWQ